MEIEGLNGKITKFTENEIRIRTNVFMINNKKTSINISLFANTTIGKVDNDENKTIVFHNGQMIIDEPYELIETIINKLN